MPADADLTPTGLAQLVADFMAALDLHDVTLVGSDTGGGISQIVIANHPQRIARLVLTNCDAYEHFPPPLIAPFKWGAYVPGLVPVLAQVVRLVPAAGRLIYALVAHRNPGQTVLRGFFQPLVQDGGVRRDATKALRGMSNRYTLRAAEHFHSFRKPVLIAWGTDDFIFFKRDADCLQRDFPLARLVSVPGSRAFISEDQPERLAELISAFMQTPAEAASSAA
jgi:pimeloyl-ACP methyl ester carboxylesterase